MSRIQLLAAGSLLLYAAFVVDAIIHLSSGDWAHPVLVVMAAVLSTTLVTRRRARQVPVEVSP